MWIQILSFSIKILSFWIPRWPEYWILAFGCSESHFHIQSLSQKNSGVQVRINHGPPKSQFSFHFQLKSVHFQLKSFYFQFKSCIVNWNSWFWLKFFHFQLKSFHFEHPWWSEYWILTFGCSESHFHIQSLSQKNQGSRSGSTMTPQSRNSLLGKREHRIPPCGSGSGWPAIILKRIYNALHFQWKSFHFQLKSFHFQLVVAFGMKWVHGWVGVITNPFCNMISIIGTPNG